LRWLADTQNADGGWGDTTKSLSNISTTALCWAAFGVPEAKGFDDTVTKAETWLKTTAGTLEPRILAKTIVDRYGKDRTFSVPILTMLTLADRLGPFGWQYVLQLAFELAALPYQWFQWLRMPVVSYALPALIAIGHVRHHHCPTWNPLLRLIRRIVHARTLRKLREIQPTTGGYLEATPLTSFVCMSLIASGQANGPVVAEGIRFLERSVRPDGSWPIDTNLSTWVTTLSVNALIQDPTIEFPELERLRIRQWILNQQYREVHPYTHAAPGGWAWTNLSGGVPDADDTAGALLALSKLGPVDEQTRQAATAGVQWLANLQNADGGIPTFCKGWTGLPFDRSSADLTAHTLLAWAAWHDHLDPALQSTVQVASRKGIDYLIRMQRPDGAWAPLWFGNQHSTEVANLTYGTSRVLRLAKVGCRFAESWTIHMQKAITWTLDNQNPDGGWGGRAGTPSSIEETSLTLEGLACVTATKETEVAIRQGLTWLNKHTSEGTQFPPSPIGFYFANLWYYETLYPLIYVNAATSSLAHAVDRTSVS